MRGESARTVKNMLKQTSSDRKEGRVGIVIQARMGSERLPGKILMPLGKYSMLEWVVERCRMAPIAAQVIVATTTATKDDPVVHFCEAHKYDFYRGSEDDVLARYVGASKQFKLDTIFRITADCPFVAPQLIGLIYQIFISGNYDYVHNSRATQTFPRGFDVEVFSKETLEHTARCATLPVEREHVTYYIYQHPIEFRIGALMAEPELYGPDLRLTVDTPEDYELAKAIAVQFKKEEWRVDVRELIAFLRKRPDFLKFNQHISQKPVTDRSH